MNRLLPLRHITVYSLALGCLCLVGCVNNPLYYRDLKPPTTACIQQDEMIIHLGSDYRNSAYWTTIRTKFRENTLYIKGDSSLMEHKRDVPIKLKKHTDAATLRVVWINPDGSEVEVPVTR